MEWSNSRIVEGRSWWSCRHVDSFNSGMVELVELSNRRVVEWRNWNGGMVALVELWNRLIVEWWNGGVGEFVDLSNRRN